MNKETSDLFESIDREVSQMEILNLKSLFWRLTVLQLLKQVGIRGVDWHPEEVFQDVERVMMDAAPSVSDTMAAQMQDALCEVRRDLREMTEGV